MTDFDRLEMQTLQDDADWRERTEWQGEVNAGQLKLEADMLAQTEIDYKAGADSPAGATDSRANPPARARESLPVKQRLLVDSLEQSALFYERHGKLRAASVARTMADKARRG